ncbi:MAG: hypothetical protein WC125_11855, partial [Bacteroidales bacterium]
MHNISIYKRLIVTLSGIIAACIIFPGVANASSFYNDKTVTISAEKAPVLGRKNYMFCGEHAGGERAAQMYA